MAVIVLLAGLGGVACAAQAGVRAVDFTSHGAAAEGANPRGIAVTETEEGQRQILVWLSSTGDSSLLVIDADTGESKQFWPETGEGGAPFSLLLTKAGHYYTYTDSHLMAYDLNAGEWLALVPGPGRFGMSFAEADDGTVYTALYPDNHLVAFDPDTRRITVHGPLYESPSSQYPGQMAVDETGWVYIGVSRSPNNLIAFNPKTEEIRPLLDEENLPGTGSIQVFRGMDGAVYSQPNRDSPWLRLYAGETETLPDGPQAGERPAISGSQSTVHRQFPDGSWLEEINISEKHATIAAGPEDLSLAGTGRTWEPTSRGSSPSRAFDGNFETYAAVPSSRNHSRDLPKDIGVEWRAPVSIQQVMVAFHSPGYEPAEDGHELQAWQDGQWVPLDAELTVQDEVFWNYRLIEPIETQRFRLFVTKFAVYRTAVRHFRVFGEYEPDRDIRHIELEGNRITFDYDSDGIWIHSIIPGPDGRIYGSTGHPLFFFAFDPETGEFDSIQLPGGHFNAIAVQQGHLFAGLYSRGTLHRYDPNRPWDAEGGNPAVVSSANNPEAMITRPYGLLAHPNGRHVIMNGFYDWRDTAGGGLLIYDAQEGETTRLSKHDLLVGHSTRALAPLPNGDLLGATTVGTRGRVEPKADQAKLYILDWASKKITHQQVPFEGVEDIRELTPGPGGKKIFGIAGDNRFFVFDSATRQIVYEELLEAYGVAAGGQAARMMILGPDESLYALFQHHIVRIDPHTYEHQSIGQPPGMINSGILIHQGRIYFTRLGELWSARLEGLE